MLLRCVLVGIFKNVFTLHRTRAVLRQNRQAWGGRDRDHEQKRETCLFIVLFYLQYR